MKWFRCLMAVCVLAVSFAGPADAKKDRDKDRDKAVSRNSEVLAEELQGGTGREIIRLFGKPELQRQENGNAHWLYRNHICALHVFVDTQDGERVRHLQMTDLNGGRVRAADCVASLRHSSR